MLLIEEVHRLKRNFPRIVGAKIMTPLMGSGTDDAYDFKSDIVLVREIWGWIISCDPDGSKFPGIKRTMEVRFTNNKRETEEVQKKIGFLLGMIVHGNYLVRDSGDALDVINDRDERFICSFKKFVAILESLLLEDNDVMFVICAFVRRQMEKLKKAHEKLIEERKKLGYSKQEQDRQVSAEEGSYFCAHENYYKVNDTLLNTNVSTNLDWLLNYYFGDNGLAREDLNIFVPKDQREKNFDRFYFTNRSIKNTRYFIKFGGVWGQRTDEKCWMGWIDIDILLSIIEKHVTS